MIVDPVMIAKGGASLLNEEAVETLKRHLLPLAYAVTPNIPEAEVLTGRSIQTMEDRKKAARELHEMGVRNIIIKGGHQPEDGKVTDLLFDGEVFTEKRTPILRRKIPMEQAAHLPPLLPRKQRKETAFKELSASLRLSSTKRLHTALISEPATDRPTILHIKRYPMQGWNCSPAINELISRQTSKRSLPLFIF